jgi:hypothetical protein
MMARKRSIIRGMLLIFFISLIIRKVLMRGMIPLGPIKKYPLEKMIL